MCLPRAPRSFLLPLPLSACYAGYQGFSLRKGSFVKNPVDRVVSSSALLTFLYHRGSRVRKEKSGAREGESRGTFSSRAPCVLARASLFLSHFPLKRLRYMLQPGRLSWYVVYVYFLYLSKVTIILPVFSLVFPFFGNVVIFFISHFHFAQKTLSRKSLGTQSSLEESFTGLIDWKAAKLDSGQNCNELNWIIDTVTIPLPGSIIESCIKVLVRFQFVDKILRCNHPNESYWAAVSCGIVYAAQGGSFKSVEEILKCDHNNESSTFLVLFLML